MGPLERRQVLILDAGAMQAVSRRPKNRRKDSGIMETSTEAYHARGEIRTPRSGRIIPEQPPLVSQTWNQYCNW